MLHTVHQLFHSHLFQVFFISIIFIKLQFLHNFILYKYFTVFYKKRLDELHKFRFQHSVKTLCRVLRVNRSTYFKHCSANSAVHICENQHIASLILHIHTDYNKTPTSFSVTMASRSVSAKCTAC